jgi:hypothetical protein
MGSNISVKIAMNIPTPYKNEQLRIRTSLYNNYYNDAQDKLPADSGDLSRLKVAIPNLIHFVWIGDINALDLSYIRIWKAANPDKTLYLWRDSDSSLCHHFHRLLAGYAAPDNDHCRLLKLQNEAFHFIYPRMDSQHSFNQLAALFLATKGIIVTPDADPAQGSLWQSELLIKEITPLFSHSFTAFRRLYYYEVIIRGNFAAASDIVRLLILYRYGGLYLDSDTLPGLEYLYSTTHRLLRQYDIPESHAIARAKSTAVLARLYHQKDIRNRISDCLQEEIPQTQQEPLCQAIIDDVAHIHQSDIRPLGQLTCYRDFPLLSALPWLPAAWFSNVIGCAPGAKAIAIILRTIRKRYRFLEKNGAIFNLFVEHNNRHYLSRLLPWRFESLIRAGNVTLALTGPGMIVEVLLALGYRILDLSEEIPPAFLSDAMRNENPGLAFFNQTLDTPLSATSTWMNSQCNNRESAR